MKEYTLSVHWKQGDDFQSHVNEKEGSVCGGLRAWAERMKETATQLVDLADLLEGQNVTADGDTHHIGFYGDEAVLDKAVEKELLYCNEVEDCDEEDFEESDNDSEE